MLMVACLLWRRFSFAGQNADRLYANSRIFVITSVISSECHAVTSEQFAKWQQSMSEWMNLCTCCCRKSACAWITKDKNKAGITTIIPVVFLWQDCKVLWSTCLYVSLYVLVHSHISKSTHPNLGRGFFMPVAWSSWDKVIKEVRWPGWVWASECFFWYRPTRVVPDKRPLNGCCCCCLILLWRRCNTLCTSGFMDDVRFHVMARHKATWAALPGVKSDIYVCLFS